MNTMTIDKTKGFRKVFTLPVDLAPEVDRYRREQPKIPSEAQAFQDLIRKGLERAREEREAKKARK